MTTQLLIDDVTGVNRYPEEDVMKVVTFMVVLIASLLAPNVCFAYRVAPALSLGELAGESDVIFKAKVLSSTVVEDPWFEEQRGVDVFETEMEVIAFIKGDAGLSTVNFQHYGASQDPNNRGGNPGPPPQRYDLTEGRSYVIFAKETGTDGVFRQLWKLSKTKRDQGAFLVVDGPLALGDSVTGVVWYELNGLLASSVCLREAFRR